MFWNSRDCDLMTSYIEAAYARVYVAIPTQRKCLLLSAKVCVVATYSENFHQTD